MASIGKRGNLSATRSCGRCDLQAKGQRPSGDCPTRSIGLHRSITNEPLRQLGQERWVRLSADAVLEEGCNAVFGGCDEGRHFPSVAGQRIVKYRAETARVLGEVGTIVVDEFVQPGTGYIVHRISPQRDNAVSEFGRRYVNTYAFTRPKRTALGQGQPTGQRWENRPDQVVRDSESVRTYAWMRYLAAGLIGSIGGLQVIGLWVSVSALGLIDDFEAGRSVAARAEQLEAQLQVVAAVSLALTVLAGMAWGSWLSSVMARITAFGVGSAPVTPRAAFLWTMVPIYGHLFRMPQIIQDTVDIQAQLGLGGRPAIIRLWRVFWVGQWAVVVASQGLDGRAALVASVVAIVLMLAAAALAILVIRELESQQDKISPLNMSGAGT